MSQINIILLLVLAFATIFSIENWSQQLSLVFLGTQTIPLPLSLWVLLSIAAGATTSWFLATLSPKPPQPPFPRGAGGDARPPITPPPPHPRNEAIPKRDKDWFDQPPAPTTPHKEKEQWEHEEENWVDEGEDQAEPQPPAIYEIPQQPKSESWSGSVYSYTYKPTPEPPEDTPEPDPEPPSIPSHKPPVQDAKYRIIVPPTSPVTPPSNPSSTAPEDDWEKPANNSDDW
ncbi:MAG TPA: LapA family protein [Oscillatoriaceae cyanobacterium M33_DOE_052]|uniref:LapA family protein n=1 Tax=Planktothricoides sp. SpSt-374 TaxID=2282167 RepID=A0A7C3ZV72_9CYAN|nr:LapA family protein [Oscillatoriaceae cyanobacterium M33_DOE_052]